MRLDLAYYGRSTAYQPITVRTASAIEREARWGKVVRALAFVGKVIATAVVCIALVWGLA